MILSFEQLDIVFKSFQVHLFRFFLKIDPVKFPQVQVCTDGSQLFVVIFEESAPLLQSGDFVEVGLKFEVVVTRRCLQGFDLDVRLVYVLYQLVV